MKKTRISYYSTTAIRYPSSRTLPRRGKAAHAPRRTSTAIDDIFIALAKALGMTREDLAGLAAEIAAGLDARPRRERGSEGGSVARDLTAAIARRALDALAPRAPARTGRRKGVKR